MWTVFAGQSQIWSNSIDQHSRLTLTKVKQRSPLTLKSTETHALCRKYQESGQTGEGRNLMRKLARDQTQMTPRSWRTLNKVPSELLMANV